MKMTDKLKKRIFYPLFFMLLAVFVAFNVYRHLTPAHLLKVRTYQVDAGWGYQILAKDKVIIDQPFIPVIHGKKAFPDKRTASRAGRMVKERMIKKELPALKKEDLVEIGLDSTGNPAR
ncbi:MAG: DUF4907 domain-containing protein [Bacteroidales bacterium]|nr:DUF4907 domain-containing protein [Bacteroidales bacterium]